MKTSLRLSMLLMLPFSMMMGQIPQYAVSTSYHNGHYKYPSSENEDDYYWRKFDRVETQYISLLPEDEGNLFVQSNVTKFYYTLKSAWNHNKIKRLEYRVNKDGYYNLPITDGYYQFHDKAYWPSQKPIKLEIRWKKEGFATSFKSRSYKIYTVPKSDDYFEDNKGNQIKVWKTSVVDQKHTRTVLISEGIDPLNTTYPESIRARYAGFINQLLVEGYNVAILNYYNNSQDARNNAAVYQAAARYISSQYSGGKDIVSVGISLGGITTRYALLEAESRGDRLPVSHWISLDSPHQGAQIDQEFQRGIMDDVIDAIEEPPLLPGTLGNKAKADYYRTLLDNTVARQVLSNHIYGNFSFSYIFLPNLDLDYDEVIADIKRKHPSARITEDYISNPWLSQSYLKVTYTVNWQKDLLAHMRLMGNYPSHTKNIGVSFASPNKNWPGSVGNTWFRCYAFIDSQEKMMVSARLDPQYCVEPGTFLPKSMTTFKTTVQDKMGIRFVRYDSPTFMTNKSALDKTNGVSAFGSHALETKDTYYHDRPTFEPEIVSGLILRLKIGGLSPKDTEPKDILPPGGGHHLFRPYGAETLTFEAPELITNPCRESININYTVSDQARIVMYDLSGKLVLDQELNSMNSLHQIPTDQFATGNYVMHLTDGGQSFMKKLVIMK